MSVIIKDDRLLFDALKTELKKANKEVVAGIQAGAVKGGVQVAEYANYNEFGTSRIPARPFMRGYIDNNKDRLMRFCRNGLTQVTLGHATFVQFLNAVGVEMTSGINKSMNRGEWVPNSPYTVKSKGANKPLIETGVMLNSVTYAIRKYGETKEWIHFENRTMLKRQIPADI